MLKYLDILDKIPEFHLFFNLFKVAIRKMQIECVAGTAEGAALRSVGRPRVGKGK